MIKILTFLALTALSQTALGSLRPCANCAEMADRLAATTNVIKSTHELNAAICNNETDGTPFAIRAIVTRSIPKIENDNGQMISVKDDDGCATLWYREAADRQPSAGDTIYAEGILCHGIVGHVFAKALSVNILSHGAVPAPNFCSIADINNGQFGHHIVTIKGRLTDIFHDDIDPNFIFLLISDDHASAYAPLFLSKQDTATSIKSLIGSKVAVTGQCMSHGHLGGRKQLGMELNLSSPNDIVVLQNPPCDPYDVSLLHDPSCLPNPVTIGDLRQKKVTGKVLAVWQGSKALLKTTSGFITEIALSSPQLPALNETIEAVGTPETDLFQLNLSKAIWRKVPDCTVTDLPPETVSAPFMLTDGKGNRKVKVQYGGRVIRLTGLVRALPAVGNGDYRLNLNCDGFDIPIDFSSVPDALTKIADGCVIEVTGVCVIETENWRPQTPFPHAKGFSVIMRTPEDIRIISRPPWLTRERLMAVIGGLALLLIGVLAWNRSLRILANRRGRELFRSQVGKIASELRVKERTRLAVELHDSLAQNLTGVSMEIEAAERSRKDGLEAVSQHLVIADKALKSCRAELRNSLWDLRSQALEEPDLDKAIRQTLLPHVKGISLFVRFNVPRSRFSDNTLHEILRIIRELTLNGIRHGGATEIRIAGAIDGDLLRFSVQDNGCGFDPDDHPGVTDGHFGLQGISERIDTYSGELSFSSAPGKGTKAVVTIPLPGQKDPEK